MLLSIFGKLPSGDCIRIKVDGQTKSLYGTDDGAQQVVSFFLKEKKQYEVELFQPPVASNRTLFWIILHALTLVFQGVFTLFRFDTHTNWYSAIHAYRVKAKLLVDMQKDMEIRLACINAKYDAQSEQWSACIFTVQPNVALEVVFSVNHRDFGNRYFNYVKQIVSLQALALPALGILLSAAIALHNIFAVLFSLFMLFGLIMTGLALCFREYRRLLVLYGRFLLQDRAALREGAYVVENPSLGSP